MPSDSLPVVGISSCLLGELVRYDGKHKIQHEIVSTIAPYNKLVSFCPEVAAGLGTPRPPVELIAKDSSILALGRNNPLLDVTDTLQKTAQDLVLKLQSLNAVAYIFKARSPSCGVATTPLLNSNKVEIRKTDGLVANVIKTKLSHLIVVDESSVNTPEKCLRFNIACQLAQRFHTTKYQTLEPWLKAAQVYLPDITIKDEPLEIFWQRTLNQYIYPWLNLQP